MKNNSFIFVMVTIMTTAALYSQIPERKDIPEKYKWDNSILYKTAGEWLEAKAAIETQIVKMKEFRG